MSRCGNQTEVWYLSPVCGRYLTLPYLYAAVGFSARGWVDAGLIVQAARGLERSKERLDCCELIHSRQVLVGGM